MLNGTEVTERAISRRSLTSLSNGTERWGWVRGGMLVRSRHSG